MPTKLDITEEERNDTIGDAEDDQEEEGQEGDNEGKQTQASVDLGTQQAIARLAQQVGALTQHVAGKNTEQQQQQISETEKTLNFLLQSGFKPEQLEAVTALVTAAQKDIKKELEAKYREDKSKEQTQTLDQRCYERGAEALEKLIEGTAFAQDDELRQALLVKAQKLMQTSPELQSARDAYSQNKVPTRADFEKAVRLVLQKLPKEFGMNNRDNAGSRSQAISKDGKVDVSKLTDYEREIYTATLNTTKNPEIALHALKTIARAK